MTTLLILLQLTLSSFTIQDYSDDSEWQISDSNISAVTRDSLGFLWLSSRKELSRFDGKKFLPMSGELNAELFADGNTVELMFTSSRDEISLYTANGLYYFNVGTRHLSIDGSMQSLHIHDAIRCDGYEILNCSSGIYRHTRDSSRLIFPYPDPSSAARKISQDSSGRLWTVSDGYLISLSLDGDGSLVKADTLGAAGRFSRIAVDRFDRIYLSNKQFVYSAALTEGASSLPEFEIAQSETTAIGEYGNVLIVCERGKGCRIITRDDNGNTVSDEACSLSRYVDDLSNTVNSIYIDQYACIWLCTRNGLFCLRPAGGNRLESNIRSDIDNPNSLSHNTVSDIIVEGRNTLWVGTASGLDRVTFRNSARSEYRIERFFAPETDTDKVTANKIEQVEFGPDGLLWIGTKKGLEFADPKTGRIFHDRSREALFGNGSFVRAIYRDRDDNMWIGFNEGGLYRCSGNGAGVERINLTAGGKTIDRCLSIVEDGDRNIWFSSGKDGIFRLDKGETADAGQYPVQDCYSLFVDPYNTVWCGTADGLFRYSRAEDSFNPVDLPLPEDSKAVVGIINDDKGNLWLSSPSGVCRYSPSDGAASFIVLNGGRLAREGFVFGSAKDSDGYIFLCGINGLTILGTDRDTPKGPEYSCRFTDFKIHNQSTGAGSDAFPQDINFCDKIVLKHSDNQLSFSFSALPFDDSGSIQYSHMLCGVDGDWVYSGTQARSVTYSNIKTGHYLLRIRCTNPMGIWQDPTELQISVKAPELLSWYCIVLYVIGLTALGFLALQWVRVRARLATQEVVSRSRQKFFREVSNDIKDPYTLLRTPLQKLIDEQESLTPEETRYLLNTVRLGSDKLALLVNQLVDYSEIDRGEEARNLVLIDMVPYLKGIYESFRKTFRSKGITLSFESSVQSLFARVEKDKMENVFFELMSYAYRNNSKGGIVAIRCDSSPDGKLVVTLTSGGSRLSREGIEHFFDIGLGLSLSKEVVTMHGGEISVVNVDEGIEFRMTLPSAGKAREQSRSEADSEHSAALDSYIRTLGAADAPVAFAKPGAPLLYIVIKDDRIREFMANMFAQRMRVRSFSSPEGVYAAALQDRPKLIISGVLFFREKLGFDLCRQVRESSSIGQTPFIFLTSYSSDSAEKEAYEAGADAFLSKPFDLDYLMIRVEKLLQSREDIISKTKKELIATPKEVKALSVDEKFLADAMKVIERNMDNENFSISDFADQMHLSSSMLYRRIKAMTGASPNEFVRDIRMKRAAQLLETNAYTVSEISYKVGFIDMHYFSTSFKKAYGMTPSEYKQSRKQASEGD